MWTYSFLVVALGTGLLSIACAIVGCLNLFRGQSLVGDAVGHSAFPGVILAFLLTGERRIGVLLLGAMITGFLSYLCVQIAHKHSKISLDAGLAIYLTGFFGLGMVLKSILQESSAYTGSTSAGLSNYIFGQASYMLESDVLWIFLISVVSLLCLILFYKEIKVYIFDPSFAATIGLPLFLIDSVISILTIALIGIGLKAVGAVMISSFLILPCVSANQWTKSFPLTLLLSSIIGLFSAFLGTQISTLGSGVSTGPCIILVAGCCALFSLFFGRYGMRKAAKRRVK